jgi:hypothetical protein
MLFAVNKIKILNCTLNELWGKLRSTQKNSLSSKERAQYEEQMDETAYQIGCLKGIIDKISLELSCFGAAIIKWRESSEDFPAQLIQRLEPPKDCPKFVKVNVEIDFFQIYFS